jgi:hypothetical protein
MIIHYYYYYYYYFINPNTWSNKIVNQNERK